MEGVEQRQRLGVAQERIGPAMQQDDGRCIRVRSAFVDLVKREVRHPYAFVGEAAEGGLLRAPIEIGSPVVDKFAEVIEIRSSRPPLTLHD